MSEKNFCIRPQYLNEFKCDGKRCGAMCCRYSWNVFIDAKTYEKYSALPQEIAQKILQHLQPISTGEKYFIVHDEKICCPFLDVDNLCSIQKAYGEDYISQVCASYPRIITRFENFSEVALSMTCPVAAELVLLKREPLKFEIVEANEKFLRLGEAHILQGLPTGFAPILIDVQLAMVSILQERRLTIDQRLIVLGFFLDRVEELLYGGKLDGATLSKLVEIYSAEKFFAEQVPMMIQSVNFNAAVHEKFMRQILTELELPTECAGKFLPAEFAMIAENFLVNDIFLNMWPWRLDTTITKNFGVFVTAYKIIERRAYGLRTVGELSSLIENLSHKIDHYEDCLTKISAYIDNDMFSLMEKSLRA